MELLTPTRHIHETNGLMYLVREVILLKVGFIGTGNMGEMLIHALHDSGAIKPEQMWIYNRTKQKAIRISKRLPGITIASSNRELVKFCDWVFLCVKPADYPRVLSEVAPELKRRHHLISITSPVTIEQLENIAPCKVIKWIPSLTNRLQAGASLLMFGNRLTPEEKKSFYRLISAISIPMEIEEEHVRIASDLISCGPAFFSYLLQNFAHSAASNYGMQPEMAEELVKTMIIGTAKLLAANYSLSEIQQAVAVPGGITRQGLDLLAVETEGVFQKLFAITHQKYQEELQKMAEKFREFYTIK